MKLERLLEHLITLRLAKQIEKEKPKKEEKSPRERLLEIYTNEKEDGERPKSLPDTLLERIRVVRESKPEKSVSEIAREKDTATSYKRAMLEVNKNG